MRNISESVLARLKNESKKREFHCNNYWICFVRKTLLEGFLSQIIRKIWFLKVVHNLISRVVQILPDSSWQKHKEIISVNNENEFIEFKIRKIEKISEFKEYHGVRVNLIGIIGRTSTPFSIDFGVGDIVIPSPVERTLPVLLPDFEEPRILTYSLESTVAEKVDAIITLMEATGRMKDFYDIYYIATTFDFEGRNLQEAIYETLTNRGSANEKDSISDILRLTKDPEIQKRWNSFCNKTLNYELDFTDVVNIIINFILPPYESILLEEEFFKNWRYKDWRAVDNLGPQEL